MTRLRIPPTAIFGIIVLALFIGFALIGPWIVPYDPETTVGRTWSGPAAVPMPSDALEITDAEGKPVRTLSSKRDPKSSTWDGGPSSEPVLAKNKGLNRFVWNMRYQTMPGVPDVYIESNLIGFFNILEACRHNPVEHLVYASSSSVYGGSRKVPFSTEDMVDNPVSLYAATKKSNELLAHSYSKLYNIPSTGLRFFTVYGPWGRPDMAPYKFTKNILEGKPIDVYNHGHHARDFTYIDDIVEGVVRTLDMTATPDPEWSSDAPRADTSSAPYRIYNIGNRTPVPLSRFIELIEQATGKTAIRNLLPAQPGDVPETLADVDALTDAVGFSILLLITLYQYKKYRANRTTAEVSAAEPELVRSEG